MCLKNKNIVYKGCRKWLVFEYSNVESHAFFWVKRQTRYSSTWVIGRELGYKVPYVRKLGLCAPLFSNRSPFNSNRNACIFKNKNFFKLEIIFLNFNKCRTSIRVLDHKTIINVS
jgi:hypothetical protein